jgi:L-amino acid N-acyltransferase YncA
VLIVISLVRPDVSAETEDKTVAAYVVLRAFRKKPGATGFGGVQ